MTDLENEDELGSPSPSRRPIIVVAVVVAVVAVLIGVVLALARADRRADPGATSPPAATTATSSSAGSSSPTRNASITSAPSTAPGSATPGSTTATTRQPAATAAAQSTRSPAPLKTPVEVKTGLTARISDIEAVDGEATEPGEIAGPAVRFTLLLANASDTEMPLETTVVNVYYGKAQTPASPLSEPGADPLPTTVAAGGEVSGTYVYVIPRRSRERVLITVDYSVDVSLVAFEGSMPAR